MPALPRYIQTVHRRGYRYLETQISADLTGRDGATLDAALTRNTSRPAPLPDALLVGRDRELALFDRSLRRVEEGERRLIFLAGEAGIGKTALVERFLARMLAAGRRRSRGDSASSSTVRAKPYLPWFDVLNHLLATTAGGVSRPCFVDAHRCGSRSFHG